MSSWVLLLYVYGGMEVADIGGSYATRAECEGAAQYFLQQPAIAPRVRCRYLLNTPVWGPVCTPNPLLRDHAVLPPCRNPATLESSDDPNPS